MRSNASHPLGLVSVKSAWNVPPTTLTSVSTRPQRSIDRVEERAQHLRIAGVPVLDHRVVAEFREVPLEAAHGLLVDVDDGDAHLVRSQVDRDLLAETTGSAGHDGHRAAQS